MPHFKFQLDQAVTVHDLGLLVKVHSTGQVVISRLPRCSHCVYDDDVIREK